MIIGIVLAGGKGTRLGVKDKNKNSILFRGKPLVMYAVDLYKNVCDQTIIVTGHQANTVQSLFSSPSVHFAYQAKRLGTGHAAQVAIRSIEKQAAHPDYIFIGYGDHMMFYTPELLSKLLEKVKTAHAAIGLLSTSYPDPNTLAWGRLIKGENGTIQRIVEQKNATEEEKQVTLINPGFYCIEYQFAKKALSKLKKNPVSKEYYLTDIVEIANTDGKNVIDMEVPFEKVGIGINTAEELVKSQEMYTKTR